MHLDLPNILRSVGPAASIVFAAWIFMGFLQQRYDAAISRYRESVNECRSTGLSDSRASNVKDQVLIYRRRCDLMSRANLIGPISAILLILSLIGGELDIIFPNTMILASLGAASALAGFALVIVAAAIVVWEGRITRRQIDSEFLDIEDLAKSAGRRPGSVSDQ